MKKIFHTTVIVAIFCLMISCKKENMNSSNNKKTVCYKVLDKINHNPLPGAYLSTAYLWDSIPVTYSGSTDASGNFCFETFNTASEADLVVSKNGYVNFCGGNFGAFTIYLTPVAYLQLHIKNIPPQSVDDAVFITYPGIYCGGTDGRDYAGANVDTTIVVPANPPGNFISWTSWHNNISVDSTHNGILLSSHDTTFFELLY